MSRMKSSLLKSIGFSSCLSFLLLASMIFTGFLGFTAVAATPQSQNVNPATGEPYGNITQYEWPQLGHDGSWSLYSPGPAPNRPEVLWTRSVSGVTVGFYGTVTAFNGYVFVLSTTGNRVYAFNAFTGEPVWNVSVTSPVEVTKIDDNYLLVSGGTGQGGLGYPSPAGVSANGTFAVFRISDGALVANLTVGGIGFQPGAGGYFPGRYDSELKMKYVRGYNASINECSYYGIDFSDPVHPRVAWKTVLDESAEELACGGGMVYIGTVLGSIWALNGTTGKITWKAPKVGFAQYSATYIDGRLIQTSASTRVTCYNASTGEVLWDYDCGGRAFFAFAGATAYGRFYQHNIAVPEGFIGCWDVETGELLWKHPALYNIGYITPVVADGKLYIQQYSGTAAGVPAKPLTFACFDAFTGQKLWEITGVSIVHPSVAYGNLYAIIGSTIYCFSDRTPKDWSMWRGNVEKPGVAQTTGPANISSPKWMFKTNGPITSSPSVVAGKVYFGSQDKWIYCVDARNGSLIWKFETGYKVLSSPAVVDGRLYTGADDGYVYCLNASTGEQIWRKPVGGGVTEFVFAATWQVRSSPIIVGNRLYVGALDGKVYCLNTGDGSIVWTYPTGGPIGGSAAYSNGVIYIGSTDHYLYALDAATGALQWRALSNATIARSYTNWFPFSTPVVAEGKVFWGAGPVYGTLYFYALNASTGTQIWRVTLTGNTPPCQTPVYVAGVLFMSEFMSVSARNATDGSLIWRQWLGHEVYSSVAYANDTRGPKIYVGSNTYSITALNATAARLNQTETVLSVYTTGAPVMSSPALWEGKLYVGSNDFHLYCFSDVPSYSPSIVAWCDWKEANVNESIVVHSRLLPGIPNEELKLTLVKPGGTQTTLTVKTDRKGFADFTFKVDKAGDWTWTVWYEGKDKGYVAYTSAYTDTNPLTVKVPEIPPPPPPTPPPPQEEQKPLISTELLAAIIIIIVIVIAAAAIILKKRKK